MGMPFCALPCSLPVATTAREAERLVSFQSWAAAFPAAPGVRSRSAHQSVFLMIDRQALA